MRAPVWLEKLVSRPSTTSPFMRCAATPPPVTSILHPAMDW
jgi:hypothetical protein